MKLVAHSLSLSCAHCGCTDGLLLDGLDAHTFHERIGIANHGFTVRHAPNKRPLIRFRIHCHRCDKRTETTIEEIDWSRITLTTSTAPKGEYDGHAHP